MAVHNRQDEILHFIEDYVQTHAYPPSVREIGAAVGLKSSSSVQHHLNALQQQGLLRMDPSRRRAITLRTPKSPAGQVPILRRVTTIQPILTQENVEGYVSINGQTRERFALRVRDESMTGAGILNGDLVIVRRQDRAANGQIVLALSGDEAAVRRLHLDLDHMWLMPENPAYPPIDGRNARILGRVIGLVREYQ